MFVSLCLADGLLSQIVRYRASTTPSSRTFTLSLATPPEDKSRELRTCNQEFVQQCRERATSSGRAIIVSRTREKPSARILDE